MTYYENVRVPAEMLVGELNGGWKLITLQLNHERIGLAAFGASALPALRRGGRLGARDARTKPAGRSREKPWVQIALAEACARLEALKVWNWRMAWELEQGRAGSRARLGRQGLRLRDGDRGLPPAARRARRGRRARRPARPAPLLRGQIEVDWRGCQINTFGGGVNEIQREIVAMLGLGLPRAPR